MKRLFCGLILACLPFVSIAASQEQTSINPIEQTLPKAAAYRAADNHIIHIGFFYTSDLLNAMTIESINDYVARQIDAANLVLQNSNLSIRREAIYIGEFPSSNQSDMAINAFLSTVYDSANEPVRDLALQYGFDYITILRPYVGNSFCGWAYYNNPYAIMEIGGNCTSPTLGAHEWGHNDGADHDVANSSDTPARQYGRGYNCGGEGTIMSTSNNWFNRHNFYSTPNKSVGNDVCGEEDNANVVRMLNEFISLPNHLGNRNDLPEKLATVRFASNQDTTVEEGEQVTVNLLLTDTDGNKISLDRPVNVEVYSRAGTATANVDYPVIAQRVTFAAGQSEQTITIGTLTDSVDETTESFTIGLRFADAAHTSDEVKSILISNDVSVTSYKLASESVRVNEGGSATISVTRSGNLNVRSSLRLTSNQPWLVVSTNELIFEAQQSSADFTVSVQTIASDQTGSVSLTPSSAGAQSLSLSVAGIHVTEGNQNPSGGGLLNPVILLLLGGGLIIRRNRYQRSRLQS